MPKFTVIIPAYNVAAYIKESVNSVLGQTFDDYELLVIDDGSTDSTPEILASFHDKHLRIIHEPNLGLSVARNTGIKEARGEYLVLLDGDDFLDPHCLTELNIYLENHPIDLLRFQVQDISSNGQIIPHPEPAFDPLPGPAAFNKLARCHYVENAWCYCYRTEFFRGSGFSYAPGRLAEDFGLTPLVIASASSVAAISFIAYNYRTRSGSITTDPDKIYRRLADAYAQMLVVLPRIQQIPDTTPILHFYVVSFLTSATRLARADFLYYYDKAKKDQLLSFIHPDSLRAYPRALLLKFAPKLFYKFFRIKS